MDVGWGNDPTKFSSWIEREDSSERVILLWCADIEKFSVMISIFLVFHWNHFYTVLLAFILGILSILVFYVQWFSDPSVESAACKGEWLWRNVLSRILCCIIIWWTKTFCRPLKTLDISFICVVFCTNYRLQIQSWQQVVSLVEFSSTPEIWFFRSHTGLS